MRHTPVPNIPRMLTPPFPDDVTVELEVAGANRLRLADPIDSILAPRDTDQS